MVKKICGTCLWYERQSNGVDPLHDDWFCGNGDSDYCDNYVGDEDGCKDWEERRKE